MSSDKNYGTAETNTADNGTSSKDPGPDLDKAGLDKARSRDPGPDLDKAGLDKARSRMISEGYKYRVLDADSDNEELDPLKKSATRSSVVEKRYIALLIIAVLIIAVLASMLVWQYAVTSGPEKVEQNQCTSKKCVRASYVILNKLDTAVDPCDDFYLFSCGNWEKTTQFPPSKPKYSSFTQIAEEIQRIVEQLLTTEGHEYKGVNSSAIWKAKTFYGMCMNDTAIEGAGTKGIKKHIADIGGWSISGQWDESKWDIQKAIQLTHSKLHTAFFHMAVGEDDKNNSRNLIYFEQSGLTLRDPREYFTNHSDYQQLKNAFLQFAEAFGGLLGAGNITNEMEEVYQFEKKMAKIFVPKEDLLDPEENYHLMSVAEFQKSIGPWFKVKEYLEGMFQRPVSEKTEMLIPTPAYFRQLGDLIQNTSKKVLANYLVWSGVSAMVGYLPKKFLDAALILDKAESGIKELSPRWQRCLAKTTSSLGFAVGALYVKDNFKESSKAEVTEMFEALREAFLHNLPGVAWMDDKTRKYALEKAEAITKMLGYPDYILDPVKLDEHYKNLTVVEGDFFGTSLMVRKYALQRNLNKLNKPPDPTEWGMTPTEVNGYYNPGFNQIAFPAGILRPPLYDPIFPKPFNFGSMGMIMGHELTHGFDNKGREYDKKGNLRNWWTNESSKAFTEHSQCIVDQYAQFEVDGTHLNGKTTLSENIADNGGLKMAHKAYLAWKEENPDEEEQNLPGLNYSQEQLFFLGMAQLWCSHYTPEYIKTAVLTDVHSIAKFRVLGSIANSEAFAQAFSCDVGSPMNPAKKCKVW